MSEEQPPKKVVRRVVKKPAPSPSGPRPTMRYGRPVVPTPSGPQKVAARDEPAPAPPTTPASPLEVKKAPRRPRPTIKAPSVQITPTITAVRERTSAAAGAVGSRGARFGRATGAVTARGWSRARGWRIPHLDPVPATIITGAIVGLVSVGLGLAALRMFTELRGVAGGGGTWGSLTLVVVTFIAFALGERLLTAFGTPLPRLTSFLAVVLTMIVILGALLGPTDSALGIVIVPVLGALTFFAAHWLLTLAESAPADVE